MFIVEQTIVQFHPKIVLINFFGCLHIVLHVEIGSLQFNISLQTDVVFAKCFLGNDPIGGQQVHFLIDY